MLYSQQMGRDAYASLRLPHDLKQEVGKIANDESRPLSSALELLIRRGVAAYKRDRLLIEIPSRKRRGKEMSEEELANRMADTIAERLLDIIHASEAERQRLPKKRDRAA